MDKLIINPEKIRGLGNIVDSKSVEDFSLHNTVLSSEGNEFSLISKSLKLTSLDNNPVGGDSIRLSATVKGGVAGETVTFKIGNIVVGTGDINNQGVAQCWVTGPSSGTVNFTATYNGVTSNTLSIVFRKRTTLSINSVTPNTRISLNDMITITGTSNLPNKPLKILCFNPNNNTLLDFEENINTNSDGSFRAWITLDTGDPVEIIAVFEGDDEYDDEWDRTYDAPVNYDPNPTLTFQKTAGKQTLSLAHGDTCTLTATLKDSNGDPIVGHRLGIRIPQKAGSSYGVVLNEGVTNNNGQFSKTYTSQGIGDFNFKATCGLLESSTYTVHDYLCVPPLNGQDSITSWANVNNANITSNGIFYSHGSFLLHGWDNANLWELEFDVKCDGNWYYVGLMPLCMSEINPFTDAKVSSYACACWEGLTYCGGFGLTSWISQDSLTKIRDNNWHHVKITKQSSTRLKTVIDNTYTAIGEYPNLVNAEELHIGTRDNPASRNSGEIVSLKNIVVKPIS